MKTVKRKLEDKLDKLVSKKVKERDNNTCQHCGAKVVGANCHWSHIIPISRNKRLKWDLNNSMVLCYHCHINWWHKHPLEAGRWLEETFPERVLYLDGIALKPPTPIKVYELEDILKRLEE